MMMKFEIFEKQNTNPSKNVFYYVLNCFIIVLNTLSGGLFDIREPILNQNIFFGNFPIISGNFQEISEKYPDITGVTPIPLPTQIPQKMYFIIF